ncbi:MAG: DUF4291 family protein [Myxococcales bacterium]
MPSSFHPAVSANPEEWERQLKHSTVRLQWDPDHHPTGAKQERRAIQLGLRGEALRKYVHEWPLRIEDVTPLVAEQRVHVQGHAWEKLLLPRETVYRPADEAVAAALGMASTS